MKTRTEQRSESLLSFANELKQAGFDVYIPEGKNPTYCNFVKDNNIGYVENSDFGFNFSTVHKPNTTTGTGFSIARDCVPSVELAYKCFAVFPSEGYSSKSVKKYSSWDDYIKTPTNQIIKKVKL